jgi:PAS domain S-box-containing protein
MNRPLETGPNPESAWVRRLAWAVVLLLLLAIVFERAVGFRVPHESFYLLVSLYFICSVMVALFVAHLIGRSLLVRATPGPLFFGSGVLLWGAAGFAGATVGRSDANVAVTIHNLCLCLSAICQLTGASLSLRPGKAMRAAGPWLTAAYGTALCTIGVIALLADAHLTPVFFVQGEGGTPLRQVVLGATIAMLVSAAILAHGTKRRAASGFKYWYSMALIMIATGLVGEMAEPSRGSVLSWTGRAGQFLGGVYMLIAAIASVRESEVWGMSLEAALRETLDYLEGLIHTANVPVIGLDWDANIIVFNEAAEKLTGYTRFEAVGRNGIDLLLSRERRAAAWEEFIRLRKGGPSQDLEKPILTKSGEQRLVSWRTNHVRERGRIVGTISFGLDITEHRKMENALRESEERFRVIASRTPDHILVQDRSLRYSFVINPLLGLSEQDMIGKTDSDFLAEEDAARLTAIKKAMMETGNPIRVETPLESRTGNSGFFDGCYVPRHGADGRIDGLIGYFRDVTEQKQVEIALHQARETLEIRVRERTEELTRMVEALNNEVAQRTLAQKSLRERSEQLRLLAAELTLAEQRERQRLVEVLHDGLQQTLVAAKFRLALTERATHPEDGKTAAQVAKLIDDAIETSRSLTAELSPPILTEGGLVAALEWLALWMQERHGLAVKLSVPSQVDSPAKDIAVPLFQATRELLFNVVKHAGAKSALVQLDRLDDGIRIVVSDEGGGFDPAGLRVAGGSAGGIGLFSMRERLHLLGGKVEIESTPGQGTRITLIAPAAVLERHRPEIACASPAQHVSIAATPQHEGISGGSARKIRVLLADDHTVVRQGLARLIREEDDMEIVGEASDGEAAVGFVRQVLPDVVLMDISMPIMNGIQATRIIHAEFPDIRVIGLSMFEAGGLAADMREAGAVDYVTKSGPSEAVIAAIRTYGGSPEATSSVRVAGSPIQDREVKA